MSDLPNIKFQLHQACVADTDRRIATLHNILDGINTSRESETKSSAGDKYETGRAMLGREEAQANRQLLQVMEDRRTLAALKLQSSEGRVTQGSLVVTQHGSYYLSVGLGKVRLGEQVYFCISVQSPIGQAFLNRGIGETVSCNGITHTIEGIF
ncbi:transcription elongation GreA/GreB family factor [Lewinella aquimaris]|uniref:Transcription elongation GreA/GreB family factor n=1 Tax=Neolewinella aquimaris TaxID=1835722 RepID=A0A840EF35_9BACT|nr:3-oxoacyl-ACP synthase [Neolewinella aquimaris]MBB4080548.1 transcription elongation GreA/GreB family factor [Neolewinella aquimaris]